jgi:filamentous hemagglutinin
VGTLQNNFNPLKGVKTLLNKDYIRSLTVSMVTAGLTEKIGGAYGIQKPDANFIKIATNPQLLAAHFQYNLLQQTVNTAVRTTLGRESFKGAVGNLVKSAAIDTAAAFAANKIGHWYAKGEVNPLEQKALHFGVGFSMGLAVNGRVDEALTAGGAAVLSETMAEGIVGDPESLTAQAKQDVQREGKPLTQENIDKASQVRRQKAANWAKLGTAVTALATRSNVDVAVRAATNAVENNFLTTSILYGKSEDAFAEAFERNLEEEEKDQSKTKKSASRLTRSKSFTELKQLHEMDVIDSIDQAFKEEALQSDSIWAKALYWMSYGVSEVEGTSASQAHHARYGMRRAVKDAPKIAREGMDLLSDKLQGRSIDDSRLEAYKYLCDEWSSHAAGFLTGFVGGIKGGKGRTPLRRPVTHHHFTGQSLANHSTKGIANQNRAPFTTQRSANANRIYEEIRAVANGGAIRSTVATKTQALQMSSSKGTGGNTSNGVGSSSSSSGQGAASGTRQGATGGAPRADRSVGRNLLTGEMEPKGKGKAVVRLSDQPKAAKNNSGPKITPDHDRIAHDSYYTRKGERAQQLDWQKRIKNAQPADYKKHIKARSNEEAKKMSESGQKHAQYLPEIDNKTLEKIALSSSIKVEKSNGTTYCFYKSDKIVGYDNGKPTQWIRAEITSGNEFHGHPIATARLKLFLGKIPQ